MTIRHLAATQRVDGRAELGEAPTWDEAAGELLWVDIIGRRVHRFDPATGRSGRILSVAQDVGAAVPRQRGGLALAVASGFALMRRGATGIDTFVPIEADRPGNRMNDGKCDPAGRFWAGTMAYSGTPGAGSLYRLDPDLSVAVILSGVTVPNGLGWSPDGQTMYFIDTSSHGVDAFEFDLSTGTIAERRRLIDIPAEHGLPDGMTVDSEGGLWVALWGGGAVHRYMPNGTLDRIVELPCRLVTSCAFGGTRLDELFITTASAGMTAAGSGRDSQKGGGLFSCQPGVVGLPGTPFAG